MEPADFYTGIVADLYTPLKSTVRDGAPYVSLVRRYGEPALELGCGDGEPLLDLRRNGLDVEGVDSSADMLDRCRRAAANEGLDVILHHQRMEDLDLPRGYRTIFLAGPTFNLLPDDDAALRALGRIRAHLDDGGVGVVPLFVPPPTPSGDLRRVRESVDAGGAVVRFMVLSEERNEATRTQRALLRYEREAGDRTETVDRQWILHWYTQAEFRGLASSAGLRAELDGPDDADEFTFLLRPA